MHAQAPLVYTSPKSGPLPMTQTDISLLLPPAPPVSFADGKAMPSVITPAQLVGLYQERKVQVGR